MARDDWTLVDSDLDLYEMQQSAEGGSRRYRWLIPDVAEKDLPDLLGKHNFEGVDGDEVRGNGGVLGRLTSDGFEVGETAVDVLRTRRQAAKNAENPTDWQLSS